MAKRNIGYEILARGLRIAASRANDLDDEDDSFACLAGVKVSALAICAEIEADNPRFDRQKFLKACGLGG